MIFINPKTDYAFKKIFGSSESKDILISFLNAMIYEGNSIIKDLEIINPNLPPRIIGLKDTYLDVKAKLKDETLVIIEMQVLNVQSFGKRVLFNAAKTYAFQLQAGEGYRMLKPVIALTITDFEMFEHSDRLISRFVYKEESTNLKYPDNDIDLVFVELPKFTKQVDQLETLTDKWIYFMKYARSLTSVPETIDNIPEIHRAFEIANQANLTREELEGLERQEMFIHDQQGAIFKAIQEVQGKEKGLAGKLISETQLEDILTNYLKTIKEVPQARDIARLMIKQLRIRNFILCYLGANSYAFVHRTFLEYFCAWEFVWQFKETQTQTLEALINDVFGKHWQDESWHEVLLLICGMIDAKFVGEIIEYLLKQKIDRREFLDEFGYLKKEGISNLLLAANCLAEVRNRSAIAPVATRLLQVLKKEVEAKEPYRFDFKAADAILMAIATNWQDDPKTLPWLKSCIQFDYESYVQRCAVRAIAQNWKDDPDTLILLKDRAQNDGDLSVRYAAVQELALGWKDDPNTLILLKDRAQNDADFFMRRTVMEELAREWRKDDPDTLILLKDRAQNDADFFVRGGAVEELARGWKDAPGMFEWLCDRAVNDPFTSDNWFRCHPRKTALEAIVSNYHDHPQTLDLLRDRADNDPDEQVRNFAKNLLERRKRAQ